MEAKQTHLIELLERIPQDAMLVVEHDQFSSSSHPVGRLCHEAITALRAALAEPEPEPVAWADKISFENAMKNGKGHDVWPKAGDYETRTGRALIGIYTTPPTRRSEPEAVAEAWSEVYRQGVHDERTSEENRGIAGFGAKVEPARQNPYRAGGNDE